MGYLAWAQSKIARMRVLDVALLKTGMFCFGIWTAQLCSFLRDLPPALFLAVFLICWGVLVKRLYL